MKLPCELSTRTSLRAFYASEHLLIAAEGDLPTPGFEVDIRESAIEIFPPEFSLLRCAKPGFFPQVITPFRYSESFRIGSTRPERVNVHHAEGTDEVEVEDCGAELAGYQAALAPGGAADEATGFSKRLSFDEAFADAVAKLPPATPEHPDMLETVSVQEIGALFGGIAGFHDLWVRVTRTHD